MTPLLDPPAYRIVAPAAPPRYDRWPEALRSAARLSGALLRCGPGLRGVGWPETPRVRAAALAEFLADGCIAAHLTAAWVWGAARQPGHPIRVNVAPRRRKRCADTPRLRITELRYSEGDTARLGEFRVTTPLRTVLDLLYASDGFGTVEQVACRLLARQLEHGWGAVDAHLRAHQRPYRRTAQARAELCAGRAREPSDGRVLRTEQQPAPRGSISE